MRIIHVVLGKAKPETADGVSCAVYHLAKYQERHGNDVLVVSIVKRLQYDGEIISRSPRVELFAAHKVPLFLNRNAIRRLKESSPDIVHLHSAFIPEFQVLGHKLRKLGIPYVITPHGAYCVGALVHKRILKRIWLELLEKKLLNAAKMIQFLNVHELQDFRRLDLKNESLKVVIPNGVQEASNQCSEEAKRHLQKLFNLPTNPQVLLFIGRLAIREKGLDLLLQGLSSYLSRSTDKKGMNSRSSNSHLLLVGPTIGNSAAILNRMAKKYGISDCVHVVGPVFGSEKLLVMAGADIVIFPSRSEGLPVALIEALSVGARCIVSYKTNMAEEVLNNHAGWACELSPEGISNALFDAIEELNCRHRREELSANAVNLVKQKYMWSSIAEEIIGYYKEITNVE